MNSPAPSGRAEESQVSENGLKYLNSIGTAALSRRFGTGADLSPRGLICR
jgi:hypothetical protein